MTRQAHQSRAGFPVTVSQTLARPAADVWAAISTPGHLEACHPFCRKNPVSTWDEAGSVDEVHYLNGRVYERRFRAWHAGAGYDLDIFGRDRHVATVSWRLEETGGDTSTLTITVQPRLPGNWPAVVCWIAHWLRIRPYLRSYLRSVVMGVDWYVTRGQPVPRNQWGRHPWFSPE